MIINHLQTTAQSLNLQLHTFNNILFLDKLVPLRFFIPNYIHIFEMETRKEVFCKRMWLYLLDQLSIKSSKINISNPYTWFPPANMNKIKGSFVYWFYFRIATSN
ncbi:hypothetical protein ACTA71_007020 [Dictyostelium dimigraforme]